MDYKGASKSVKFNPVVSVVSVGTVDQAVERSLESGDMITSPINLLKMSPSSILINTTEKVNATQIFSPFSNDLVHMNATGENTSQISYHQLQIELNKLMGELEFEEALFLEQTKKANNQDMILTANSKKIEELEAKVETLGNEYDEISNKIYYLNKQQSQMEVLLSKLESSMPDFHPEETDPQRLHLYKLSHDLGQDLMQIEVDLDFAMEQINETNKLDAENNEPILNTHIDALTWVEENCDNLKTSLQIVQQEHETIRTRRVAEMESLV